jgi:hypothetical protein
LLRAEIDQLKQLVHQVSASRERGSSQ